MKRKLMTWEKFEETFKPLADSWHEYVINDNNTGNKKIFHIVYNKENWPIYKDDMKKFGTEIEVEKSSSTIFKYVDNHNILWHESWFESEFEPIEFITEEEFKV